MLPLNRFRIYFTHDYSSAGTQVFIIKDYDDHSSLIKINTVTEIPIISGDIMSESSMILNEYDNGIWIALVEALQEYGKLPKANQAVLDHLTDLRKLLGLDNSTYEVKIENHKLT
jgi:hypothetical protein